MIKYDSFRQLDAAQDTFGRGFRTSTASGRKQEMKMLSLYLRDRCGLGAKERESYLKNFCSEFIPGFVYRAYYSEIAAACRFAENPENVLIQIDSLPVYKAEVEWLQEMDIPKEEKTVMFCMLMMKKLDRECFIQRHSDQQYKMGFFSAENDKLKALKKQSGYKGDLALDVFYEWRRRGLVDVTYNGYILRFMEGCEERERGEIVCSVTHYDCFGDWWNMIIAPEKYGRCKRCGKPFRSSGKRIYCREHEQTREQKDLYSTRQAVCEVCGAPFFVIACDNRTRVCPPCKKKKEPSA